MLKVFLMLKEWWFQNFFIGAERRNVVGSRFRGLVLKLHLHNKHIVVT